MKARIFLVAAAAAALVCFTVAGVFAAEVRGVTDKEVVLACLVDFSGPGKFAGPPIAEAFKH